MTGRSLVFKRLPRPTKGDSCKQEKRVGLCLPWLKEGKELNHMFFVKH